MGTELAARTGFAVATALDDEVTEVLRRAPENRLALMLYGSVARGTADTGSDIDILELVSAGPAPYTVGNANVTQYEVSHLRALATQGSPFVLHLRKEGSILADQHGVLQRTLDAYITPKSYQHIWSQFEAASAALDPSAEDFDRYAPGLGRLGNYLLRTAVYIRSIERGETSFNLASMEWVSSDPSLVQALALRRNTVFSSDDIKILRRELGRLLPRLQENPYRSVEALAVASSDRRELAALFTPVLQDAEGVEYSALTLPPF